MGFAEKLLEAIAQHEEEKQEGRADSRYTFYEVEEETDSVMVQAKADYSIGAHPGYVIELHFNPGPRFKGHEEGLTRLDLGEISDILKYLGGRTKITFSNGNGNGNGSNNSFYSDITSDIAHIIPIKDGFGLRIPLDHIQSLLLDRLEKISLTSFLSRFIELYVDHSYSNGNKTGTAHSTA